jgi:riboflavin synthase
MPKQVFEAYRNDAIKTHEDEDEDEQYSLAVDEHQMPDHPSTVMKMVKGSSQTISAANDERRQVLPSRVIQDGSIAVLRFSEIM